MSNCIVTGKFCTLFYIPPFRWHVILAIKEIKAPPLPYWPLTEVDSVLGGPTASPALRSAIPVSGHGVGNDAAGNGAGCFGRSCASSGNDLRLIRFELDK